MELHRSYYGKVKAADHKTGAQIKKRIYFMHRTSQIDSRVFILNTVKRQTKVQKITVMSVND